MRNIKLLVIAPIALLVGCVTVGPDYQAPQEQAVELHVAKDIETASYERLWWQRFNDDVLNKLVALTLENNYSLEAAKANIDRALANFADVDNDDRPVGSVDVDYHNSKAQQPDFTDERIYSRRYQVGANLTWQLDLVGKLERASESAYANAESVQADLHALQVSIVSNLVSLYADYRGLQKRVQVAHRNVDILKQTADITQLRFEEGMASEFEFARVQAQLSSVQASIAQLDSLLKQTEYDLALLAGYQAASLPVDLLEEPIPSLNKPVAIGDVGELLLRRPDVRSAERRLAAATAQIGVAKADLYPAVNVSGFLGFLTGHASGLDNSARAWTVAPSLSWQGLDMGSVKARINIANAEQRKALADYQQQVLVAVNDAQSALSTYSFSQQQLHHLADQQQASEKAMELATLQYESGVFDLLDLIDTERTLLASQDSYAAGQAQVMKDLVAVYQAFGGAIGQ